MGGLEELFIDPTKLPEGSGGAWQLLFLLLVYGYILTQASNLISDGSELLLLVPSLSGVVGSCVLPVLGAVPDGAIVLFSGLGSNAAEEVEVGVGALAGSTIMLLTLPWALSIMGGRVTLDARGQPCYRRPAGQHGEWDKLQGGGLSGSGVLVGPPVRLGATLMLVTGLAYAFIQIPAFVLTNKGEDDGAVARGEHWYALAGLLYCGVCFVGYLVWQFRVADSDKVKQDRIAEVAREQISKGQLSLVGVIAPELMEAFAEDSEEHEALLSRALAADRVPAHIKRRVAQVVHPLFHKYDSDRSGYIDMNELRSAFTDLGEAPSSEELLSVMAKHDVDRNGTLDVHEFVSLALDVALEGFQADQLPPKAAERRMGPEGREGDEEEGRGGAVAEHKEREAERSREGDEKEADSDDEDDDDEEEDEVPEDLRALPWPQQQLRIKVRSAAMMLGGTALVLLFADPMVGVLSELGKRINVGSFYVSFVLSPLASNASELLASYNYAKKKSSRTINIALSALTGAGVMNNTFTTGIFFLIVLVKRLAWTYSAECIAILAVEIAVAMLVFLRPVHTPADALFLVGLFPASLAMVAVLEKYAGWN